MSVAKCLAELTKERVQKVAVSHGVRAGVRSRDEPKVRFSGAPDQSRAVIAMRPESRRLLLISSPKRWIGRPPVSGTIQRIGLSPFAIGKASPSRRAKRSF